MTAPWKDWESRGLGERFDVLGELLAISGLGQIRRIHSGEKTIEGGNLRDDSLVAGALETERQRVHVQFNFGASKLFRQDELYRHRRCIAQHRTGGQEQLQLRLSVVHAKVSAMFFPND